MSKTFGKSFQHTYGVKFFYKMALNKYKKVLFYAPILEYPTKGGPGISVSNAIKVLSKVSDLHVISSADTTKEKRINSLKFFSNFADLSFT